ncbi:TPA: hypothetical protein PNO69_004539 [Salmonella enterica]|nr:hypothetical protein [Salmonella enterica]HCH9607982.1 hypothetical protein [Salmonella enterica]HDI5000276.1 hypothetical protein [Salmonella enterica]HDI5005097.1 hypothetical protein [Salmonella enterica]
MNDVDIIESGIKELRLGMFSDKVDDQVIKDWVLKVSEKLLTDKGIELKRALEREIIGRWTTTEVKEFIGVCNESY